MKAPRVSIIIPTKNEEKVLDACLRSLKTQKTTAAYEIIIVDTNSTDATRAIAKKYGSRIINESRAGRNFAQQTGAKYANGEILCFTEADCLLPNNWVSRYSDAFESYPHISAFVGTYVYRNSTYFLTVSSRILMPVLDTLFRLIHGHYAFRASNFAIKKTTFDAVGGINLKAIEYSDVELSMRVAKKWRIKYIPTLTITTHDRRVRGRLFRYIQEASTNYIRTCILKQNVSTKVFADIR